MKTDYDKLRRRTTYTLTGGVQVVIPDVIAEKHYFADQDGDVAGIIECIGEAIGLTCCDLRVPIEEKCDD